MVYIKTLRFGMVKKISTLLPVLFCFFPLFPQNGADLCVGFIDTVLRTSPAYQSALLEYNNAVFVLQPYKYRWLPRPAIDMSYGGFLDTDKTVSAQSHALKTAFVLLQEIPGGIGVQVQADQFFALNKKSGAARPYEFSVFAAVHVPVYAAAPEMLSFVLEGQSKAYNLEKDMAELQLKIAEKRIIADAVFSVGRCLLLHERILLEQERQELQKKDSYADEQLWRLGRLSSFELAQRNTDRFESYVAFLQMKRQYENLIQSLYVFGLETKPLPFDIDVWIDCWETYTEKNSVQNALSYVLEAKRLERAFYTETERQLSSLPLLRFSASAEPTGVPALSDGASFFPDFIGKYWKNAGRWNWNFSLALRLPLYPFAAEYRQNAFSVHAWRFYKLSEEQLFKNRELQEKHYQTNLCLLKNLSEKALKDKIDSDNKTLTARTLCAQGYLSETGFEYQKLNARLAANMYKEVRLNRISALLNGY
ncbi:hypothetical protein H0R92_05730 [Treponema sp. OMZ 840]|uniref:hypothetical protein n=1 Tax=Treponema sp. OMZ 840 TaxID=244313 RepID=UPI003D8FB6E1